MSKSVREESYCFDVEGYLGRAVVGLVDGTPAVLLLEVHQEGPVVKDFFNRVARGVSNDLRKGVPIEQIIKGFDRAQFRCSEPALTPEVRAMEVVTRHVFGCWLKDTFLPPAEAKTLES